MTPAASAATISRRSERSRAPLHASRSRCSAACRASSSSSSGVSSQPCENQRVGAIVVAEIAEARHQRVHARGLRGLHVALGIADVHAFARARRPWSAAACSSGSGCGLRSRQRVAADHGARAGVQPHFDQQRIGEPAGLVRDDAPVQGRGVRGRRSISSPPSNRQVCLASCLR